MKQKPLNFSLSKEPNTSDIPQEVKDWYKKIGSKKSKAKTEAARENGKLGGRPKKKV
jgi:hypothetical protein